MVVTKDFISQLVTVINLMLFNFVAVFFVIYLFLIKELGNSFKEFNLVLGVAVSASKEIAEKIYEIPLISKYFF